MNHVVHFSTYGRGIFRKNTILHGVYWCRCSAGTRELEGDSGGEIAPQFGNFRSVASQLWAVDVVFFLHVNLGPSQKIVGQIRGVFSLGRGYLEPREMSPPPQHQSSSPVPGEMST